LGGLAPPSPPLGLAPGHLYTVYHRCHRSHRRTSRLWW